MEGHAWFRAEIVQVEKDTLARPALWEPVSNPARRRLNHGEAGSLPGVPVSPWGAALRLPGVLEGGMSESKDCLRCNGCGQITNSSDGEAWTYWEQLPPESDIAVRMGIVKPVTCPTCGGTGKRSTEEP